LIRITAENRGPDDAPLNLLPTLWFRNTWTDEEGALCPTLFWLDGPGGVSGGGIIRASNAELGDYELIAEAADADPLFCENETNPERIYGKPREGFAKDGINDYVVQGDVTAINRARTGTKAALHYQLVVPAHDRKSIQLRLRKTAPPGTE